MSTSTFELFKIGVGPSSSHTVGPMKACNMFLQQLGDRVEQVQHVQVELFGSLALTGKGHATDKACLLGLSGMEPEHVVDADEVLENIERERTLLLGGKKRDRAIPFDPTKDIVWQFERLPEHANAMTVRAFDAHGTEVEQDTYFSIGGGFIRTKAEMNASKEEICAEKQEKRLDMHFTNMEELLALCDANDMAIKDVMRHNERAKGLSDEEIDAKLDRIWDVMHQCIMRGLTSTDEYLPGSLKVKRRARRLHEKERHFKRSNSLQTIDQPYLPMLNSMSKLSMYAIAVNEENAGGWSQIVTAPTNGASGVVPACLQHLMVDLLHPRYVNTLKPLYDSYEHAMIQAPRDFLLTAGAIGALIKQNSSISGAEAGCMGEIGSASSMAAAGLAAALGGSPHQVENAAEMAMEHSLGLTCDPIEGLVQIPCIERNAMGATKALNACTLALMSNEEHSVNFDTVIKVMKKIGKDMKAEYKETALGGLAAAFKMKRSMPEC